MSPTNYNLKLTLADANRLRENTALAITELGNQLKQELNPRERVRIHQEIHEQERLLKQF